MPWTRLPLAVLALNPAQLGTLVAVGVTTHSLAVSNAARLMQSCSGLRKFFLDRSPGGVFIRGL
jgi:hypothetical protein